MRQWALRPKEEAYLLNPAFCCAVLTAAIGGFSSIKKEGIPFPLLFMVPPMVLHKPTRDALPPDIRTSLAVWLQDNSSAHVLFYERLISLKSYTKEAIQFGMLLNWIMLDTGGLIQTSLKESDINKAIQKLSDETRECVMRARFVGKWFGSAGDTHMVMAFWGIRP